MVRGNRKLYVDPGGKDIGAGLGRGRKNTSVDTSVEVEHQARDESDRHAGSKYTQAASDNF